MSFCLFFPPRLYFVCVLPTCMYVFGGQQRVADVPGLELKAAVRQYVLEIEPSSSAKTPCSPRSQSSSHLSSHLSNSLFYVFETERHQLVQSFLCFRFPFPSPGILGAHICLQLCQYFLKRVLREPTMVLAAPGLTLLIFIEPSLICPGHTHLGSQPGNCRVESFGISKFENL